MRGPARGGAARCRYASWTSFVVFDEGAKGAGSDLGVAAILAEELREAVSIETVGDGRRVTMSFGVGASVRGARFDYRAVFGAADAALYEAKRRGNERVYADRQLVMLGI